jgi:hypothetical protein
LPLIPFALLPLVLAPLMLVPLVGCHIAQVLPGGRWSWMAGWSVVEDVEREGRTREG